MKGVSYIGAYQALKEHWKENLHIRSIIGSSAGGILGLAICCELKDEEIMSIVMDLENIASDDQFFKDDHRGD